MATKRTPINRPPKRQIPPEAIAAFKRMAARPPCTCRPVEWFAEYWKNREPCPSCEFWWEEHSKLHDALRLKPWVWPAIQHPDTKNPWPEGSYMAGKWRPDERAVALYRELEKAARAND